MSYITDMFDLEMVADAIAIPKKDFPFEAMRKINGASYTHTQWLIDLFDLSPMAEFYSDVDPDTLGKALRRAHRNRERVIH